MKLTAKFAIFIAFMVSMLQANSMIFLIDGSGENYNCDSLRESNFKMIEKKISKKYLQENKINNVYFALFSRNIEFKSFATDKKYKRKRDDTKYRKLAKLAKEAFKRAKTAQKHFYEGKDQKGKKVKYGKDVAGAIQATLRFIQENKLASGREKVELVIASDLWQSINKEATKKELYKNHIKIPKNVKITILGKVLSCDQSQSQSAKISFENSIKRFWTEVIDSNHITYLTSY